MEVYGYEDGGDRGALGPSSQVRDVPHETLLFAEFDEPLIFWGSGSSAGQEADLRLKTGSHV